MGEGVGVYAEAKGEYTKQLCQYMLPALQQYFLDMLEDATQKEPIQTKVLLMFQHLLEGITDWNADKVQRETASLSSATHCDYLEELLTAVFIAHTKVLSAIRLTTKQKKLQITIPKLDHFLHRTLTECARLLWSNMYLFSMSSPSIERQKNLRQIEGILQDGILQAIRGMLPVKNILREYLKDEEDDEVEKVEKGEEQDHEQDQPEEKELLPITAPDISGLTPIVVEDKPQTPFTGIDTAFVTEDETHSEDEVDEEIKILDNPPEAMDEFEDLDVKVKVEPEPEPQPEKDDILQMDFEELV